MEHCWQQSFSSHFFSSSKKIVIYNDDDKGKERGHSTTTLPYWRPQPLCLLSSLFTVLKTGLYVLHVHTVVVVGVVLLHNILYICVAGERKRGRCHKHCPSGWPAILNTGYCPAAAGSTIFCHSSRYNRLLAPINNIIPSHDLRGHHHAPGSSMGGTRRDFYLDWESLLWKM